jgi:hypothetical protein
MEEEKGKMETKMEKRKWGGSEGEERNETEREEQMHINVRYEYSQTHLFLLEYVV